MVGAVAFLGVLDILCGFLLVFEEKRIRLFASKKKKSDGDVD
jgi:hypothetical protein